MAKTAWLEPQQIQNLKDLNYRTTLASQSPIPYTREAQAPSPEVHTKP